MQPPNESPLPLDEEAAALLGRHDISAVLAALIAAKERRESTLPKGATLGGNGLAERVARAADEQTFGDEQPIQQELLVTLACTGATVPTNLTIATWTAQARAAVLDWTAQCPNADQEQALHAWWTARPSVLARLRASWEPRPLRLWEPQGAEPTPNDAEVSEIHVALTEALREVPRSRVPDIAKIAAWNAACRSVVLTWAKSKPTPDAPPRSLGEWWGARPFWLFRWGNLLEQALRHAGWAGERFTYAFRKADPSMSWRQGAILVTIQGDHGDWVSFTVWPDEDQAPQEARVEGRIVVEPEDRTPTAEDAEPFAKRLSQIRDVLLEAFEGVSSLPDMEEVVDWTAEDLARVRRWAARRPVRAEEEARRAWWSTRPDVLMAYAPWFIPATPLSGVIAGGQVTINAEQARVIRTGHELKSVTLDEPKPVSKGDQYRIRRPGSSLGARVEETLWEVTEVGADAIWARPVGSVSGPHGFSKGWPWSLLAGGDPIEVTMIRDGLRVREASLSARGPVSGPARDERVLGEDRGPGISQVNDEDRDERADRTYVTYARVPSTNREMPPAQVLYEHLVKRVCAEHAEELEATFGRAADTIRLPELALWYALREPQRAFEALLPVTRCPAQALDALCPNPAPLAWGWLAVEHPSAVLTMLQRFVVEAVIQVTRIEGHPVATEAMIREHLPKAWRAHGIKQALHALVSCQILREHNGIPDMGFSLRSNEAEDASPADPRRPVMGFARERAAHAAELRSFFGKPADELSASQVALWFAIRHPGAASSVLREFASTGANGPVHLETLSPFTYRHARGWAHVEAPDSWEKMTVLEWAVLDVLVRDGGPDALTLEGIAERLDHPPVVLDEVIRALHGLRALNVAHEVAEGWRVGVQPSRETLTRNLEERAQEGDLLAKKIVDAARAAGLLFEGDVSFTAGHLLYLVELLGEVGRNEVLALQAFKAKTARLVEAEVYRAAQRDDAAWGPGHEVSLERALAYHRKATDTRHGLGALFDGAHHAVAHLEGPLQESGALAKRWGQRVLEMNLPPVRTAPPAREDAPNAAKDGPSRD